MKGVKEEQSLVILKDMPLSFILIIVTKDSSGCECLEQGKAVGGDLFNVL